MSIYYIDFLRELLWKLCLTTHREWAWLFCTSEHIANMDLLKSCHRKGVWSFCIVHTFFLASVPAILAWLRLQVWSKHTQINMQLFIHKDKSTTHLPHNMQQSIHYNCILSQKPAATGHSDGQHRDQYSRLRHGATFSSQQTLSCITCAPTHAVVYWLQITSIIVFLFDPDLILVHWPHFTCVLLGLNSYFHFLSFSV